MVTIIESRRLVEGVKTWCPHVQGEITYDTMFFSKGVQVVQNDGGGLFFDDLLGLSNNAESLFLNHPQPSSRGLNRNAGGSQVGGSAGGDVGGVG